MTYSDTYSDTYEASTAEYDYVAVPWGQLEVTLHELAPGEFYDVSVAAYDFAGRTSGFAADVTATAASDAIAPGTPAAPVAVGSPLAVQITHELGLNTGGTYNLPSDLDHLNVYIGTTVGFPATPASKVGSIPVTSGHLRLGIPAIGSFPFPDDTQRYVRVSAVDESGNESDASVETAVVPGLIDTQQIALLAVDDARINNVKAGKIEAGSITGQEIIIAGGASGILRSDNYVQGSDGWKIDGAGNFEANDAIFRGTISGNLEGFLTVIDLHGNDIMEFGETFHDNPVPGHSDPHTPMMRAALGLFAGETYTIPTFGSVQIGNHSEPAITITEYTAAQSPPDLYYPVILDVTALSTSDALVSLSDWTVPNNIDETQYWKRGYELTTLRWAIGNAGLQVDQSDVKAPLMEGMTAVTNVTAPSTGSWLQWGTEEIDIAWPASTPCRVYAFMHGTAFNEQNSGGPARCRGRVVVSFDGGSTWGNPVGVSGVVDNGDRWDGLTHMQIRQGTPTGNIQVRMEYQLDTASAVTDFINGRMGCVVLGDI